MVGPVFLSDMSMLAPQLDEFPRAARSMSLRLLPRTLHSLGVMMTVNQPDTTPDLALESPDPLGGTWRVTHLRYGVRRPRGE